MQLRSWSIASVVKLAPPLATCFGLVRCSRGKDLFKECEVNVKRHWILDVYGPEWGANTYALKPIYTDMIRSNLEYSCILYDLASATLFKKLNTIQNQAKRRGCGAITMTLHAALLVEID